MKARAFWILSSVIALGETAPTLDRSFLEKLSFQPAYEFEIRARGIVEAQCSQGESRVRVLPLKTIQVGENELQQVRFQSRICTTFGFRQIDQELYLPSELFQPQSELVQGVWQSKTYTDIPSVRKPGETVSLQIKRVGPDELVLTWLPEPFSSPESSPIRMKLADTSDMSAVENWHSDLVPWREIYLDFEDPFLKDPIVMDGRLNEITQLDRS